MRASRARVSGCAANDWSRCSKRAVVACSVVLAVAVSMVPSDIDALSNWNHGSTAPSAMSRPPPSAPSIAVFGTFAPLAVIGLDALPRRPRPSNGALTVKPGAPLGTSHKVDGPSPSIGLLVHTYESASPAEVTQLFSASNTAESPSARAVPRVAQKWLRDPF